MTTTSNVQATLKWNKQIFPLVIQLGKTAAALKERISALTNVPVARQKLLSKKGGWKGMLKDTVILTEAIVQEGMVITLIGSAETLKTPLVATKFEEDLTAEELAAADEERNQKFWETAEGMIPALQLLPQHRDDNKQEWYAYNRLVTGLPQRQIEQELRFAQKQKLKQDSELINDTSAALQGKVALQLGLELRRAYVNNLAVLEDGTCVSVLDDGHVQLWKHAAQQEDIIHPAPPFQNDAGGVNSVVALKASNESAPAFATAGRGTVKLWTIDGEAFGTLSGSMPGTTPASLTTIFGKTGSSNPLDMAFTCLASRIQVTRNVQDPSQMFRLSTQNEAERQRRAQAENQERATQQALARASQSVQVWYHSSADSTYGTISQPWASQILELSPEMRSGAPITSLAVMQSTDLEHANVRFLVAGDAFGGLTFWKVQIENDSNSLSFTYDSYQKLAIESGGACSVVCMEPLQGGLLAVSTTAAPVTSSARPTGEGSNPIRISNVRAVQILDMSTLFASSPVAPTLQSTLTGHSPKDAVICMCELPDGGLLTGGGKIDATLQLWSPRQLGKSVQAANDRGTFPSMEVDQIESRTQSTAFRALADVGYVFALAVLPDTKRESDHFAVAVARYNTVKIIL